MSQKNESVTFELNFPISTPDGEFIRSVTMRRPKVGDVLKYPVSGSGDMQGEVNLVSALCGLCPEDVREMELSDYGRLQDQLLAFRNSATA